MIIRVSNFELSDKCTGFTKCDDIFICKMLNSSHMIIIQWLLFYCNTKNKINGRHFKHFNVTRVINFDIHKYIFKSRSKYPNKKKLKISYLNILGLGTFHNHIYYKFLNPDKI